jgi:hypothetical protein
VLTRAAAAAAALALTLTGCAAGGDGSEQSAEELAAPPEIGACRVLEPADVGASFDDSPTVDCDRPHTAETFAVGTFPSSLDSVRVKDKALGAFIYRTCNRRFQAFLGGDESTVMRSLLTWAWFRPSQEAWDAGARWYRCDVVSGSEESERLRRLPTTARNLLAAPPPDEWMTCAVGEQVSGSRKVPCSRPHDWRAVTTIKVPGDEDAPYPGDRVVEVRTRDYCSDSVGAWLNYPVDYEFGYTYFRRAEWKAGNRRSICWARTDQ